MHETHFDQVVEAIVARDKRFAPAAYAFVRDALDYTQKRLSREARGRLRHVSGRELLEGIRDAALEQFGPMVPAVFEEWGIRRGEDFGEIVFNLVDSGLLAKTDTDTRHDFAGVLDFDETFRKPFRPTTTVAPGHRGTTPVPT